MKPTRASRFRPIVEHLESRELPAAPLWAGYAGNAQHAALSGVASQSLATIRWSTPVDLAPQYTGSGQLLIHYGSPSITQANTVIVPVKTGPAGGFEVEGFDGSNGSLLWTQRTDYIAPTSKWTPSFSGVLAANGSYIFPGAGGTVYFISNPDMPGATINGQVAFYGSALYQQNPGQFNSTVQIDTPLTADSGGDIFFGFIVTGPNSANLQSGIARIDANGNGQWVAVQTAAGDSSIIETQFNAAPALSNDQQTLYVAVNTGPGGRGDLLALNSTTLATVAEAALIDPATGNNASLLNASTASPMVAPDGTVFFGILGNPSNGARGFMLHFSADLSTSFTPGAFGWDDTASIVPSSMVPSYTGSSSFLIFTKYNNYVAANVGPSGGDGFNEVAVLDPYATQLDTRNDGNPNLQVMMEIMTIAGPTPDAEYVNQGFPNAVKEWCINTAVVDPATDSILVNSEDGTLYRWNLSTGALTQRIVLAPPTGEAYTPTIIGADGTVYAINNATLWAVGALPNNTGTPNQRFVLQIYHDLLGRQADAAGLAYWSSVLDSGASRNMVVVGVENSLEFRTRLIESIYETYLHRQADPVGLNNDLLFLARNPTIPGVVDPAEQLRLAVLGSAEYLQTRGSGSAAGFLTAVYNDVLGRAVDPSGAQTFLSALASGASTAQVARAILTSREADQDFVRSDYGQFLRRRADPGGLNTFVSLLLAGQPELSVWDDLMISPEYFTLAQQQ
jgi:hypothetical protein